MSFFKHVGSANGKKVIIVQRSLPGPEEHMAAVIYSEIMPSKYHDDVMKLLESDEGQHAYEFRDILSRRMMSDGNNTLQALSDEGYLKKVAANNVQVTPNSKSTIRLDELNNLLNMVGKGDEAMKKLERLENSQGMRDPGKVATTDAYVSENVNYDQVSDAPAPAAPVAAPAMDQMSMMMEMMKTMQSLQAEVAAMKGGAEPKKSRGRPAKASD